MKIEEKIKSAGFELGFTHVGIAPAHDYEDYERDILGRPDYAPFTATETSLLRRIARTKTLHPQAQSIICATLGYGGIDYPETLTPSVARTYLSRTYTPPADMQHGVQIEAFARALEDLGLNIDRNQFNLPQRLACAEAGVVTLGRNNFAYTPEDGSFNILVTFLTTAKLECDQPTFRCECPEGCERCIHACPTQAIAGPRRLMLDRCILFNNQRFELGAQEEVWAQLGQRIHGCDECQLACPRNRAVLEGPKRRDAFLDLLAQKFDLEKILALDDEYYRETIHPIMYNYIKDLDIFRRNAAIALGNSGDPSHLPALRRALEAAGNPPVRKAIEWAIARLERSES
ncbi:MAG: 4Fe-4S double cluster binding domain-containing protein [Eggerthellaceae bacterium]|nr:4Fe-4S double cluster binding domain-containing protein [Eggerthellaceae bacterium]